MNNKKEKRLILIDDHRWFRAGITECITKNSDWKVFAEASNYNEVLKVIDDLKKINSNDSDIYIALIDISFKDSDNQHVKDYGFEIITLFEKEVPFVKSIVLSSHDSSGYVQKALSLGAKGYISKTADDSIMFQALESVAAGKSYIQNELVSDLLELKDLLETFTKKEREVTSMLNLTITNNEIAEKMNISVGTVENYIGRIYDKTGTNDRLSLLEKLGKI